MEFYGLVKQIGFKMYAVCSFVFCLFVSFLFCLLGMYFFFQEVGFVANNCA